MFETVTMERRRGMSWWLALIGIVLIGYAAVLAQGYLSPVTEQAATAANGDRIVTWRDKSINEHGYKVYRGGRLVFSKTITGGATCHD